MSAAPRPVTAFALSLAGLLLQAVAAVYLFVLSIFGASFWAAAPSMMMGPWMMTGPWFFSFGWAPYTFGFGALTLALGTLGVLWLNTADPQRVRTGATLVLIAAVLAFPTMFGFLIGSLLMFVGSILGLTWQPPQTK